MKHSAGVIPCPDGGYGGEKKGEPEEFSDSPFSGEFDSYTRQSLGSADLHHLGPAGVLIALPPLLVYSTEHYTGPQPLLFRELLVVGLEHCLHTLKKIRVDIVLPSLLSLIVKEHFLEEFLQFVVFNLVHVALLHSKIALGKSQVNGRKPTKPQGDYKYYTSYS